MAAINREKPVNAEQAKDLARMEALMRSNVGNPQRQQVLKKYSKSLTSQLSRGGPPPVVGT